MGSTRVYKNKNKPMPNNDDFSSTHQIFRHFVNCKVTKGLAFIFSALSAEVKVVKHFKISNISILGAKYAVSKPSSTPRIGSWNEKKSKNTGKTEITKRKRRRKKVSSPL